MENRSRLLVIVLIAALALVGGFAAGLLLNRDSGTTGETPSAIAEASASVEASSSEEPSAEPSESAAESASAEASAAASPTTTPAPTATITFTDLFLDATDNPDGKDRVITWTGATGGVSATITSVTPMGSTVMCLKTATKVLGCRTAGEGKLTAKTTKPKETYILTLRGDGVAQPIVNVKLTFPAAKPKVQIENARFDGTSFPDTNGIQALITPRADGDVHLVAEWGGKPFLYEIDLIEQGGSGSQTIQPAESNVGTDTTLPVTATNPWKLVLQNIETGMGVTPMTATVSWP